MTPGTIRAGRPGPSTRWCCARRLAVCALVCSWWPVPSVNSQPYVHRDPVIIEQNLCVKTGILAGTACGTTIVFPNGSLNTSVSIPDASITLAKLADANCADEEAITWDEPSGLWICGAGGAGGGFDPTADAVISGNWRFSTMPVVGDDPPGGGFAGLHLYKTNSQAAFRLERGSGNAWDFKVDSDFVLSARGGETLLTTTASGGVTLGVADRPTALPGDVTVGTLSVGATVQSALRPGGADLYDLGGASLPWREAFISQLNTVVFAERSAALLGGWLIVGKSAGSLDSDLLIGENTATFDQAQTPGHFILIRAKDLNGTTRSEYLQVGALVSGTRYAVTRDLAGTGQRDWSDGTPYLVLGASGDGRVELTAYTTPKLSIFRQGATYGAVTEDLRLGYLDGYGAIPAGKFGVAIGSGANSLTYYDGLLTIAGNGSSLTSINGGNITTQTITATQIATNTLTATQIATNAITADELAAGAVVAGDLAADAVTAGSIAANAITSREITGGTITAQDIATDLLMANLLRSSGVTGMTVGNGFWLDAQTSTPTFRVGTASGGALARGVLWNGSDLLVKTDGVNLDTASGLVISAASNDGDFPRMLRIGSSSLGYYDGYLQVIGTLHLGEYQGVMNGVPTSVRLNSDNGQFVPSGEILTLTLDATQGLILNWAGQLGTVARNFSPDASDTGLINLGSSTQKWGIPYFNLPGTNTGFVPVGTKGDGALYYVYDTFSGCLAGRTILNGLVMSAGC